MVSKHRNHRNIRTGFVLAAVNGLLFGAVGCMATEGTPSTPEPVKASDGTFAQSEVRLKDGRTVECVTWHLGTSAGGVSCNWGGTPS